MLYDPKWEQTTQTDPFSLESLIAWLEKQPEDKSYCYTSSGRCLLAQYFTAQGFADVLVGAYDVDYSVNREWDTNVEFGPAFHDIAQGYPRDFGAALARARKALAAR